MDEDQIPSEENIHKIATVPPPRGDADAYEAVTRVAPLPAELLAELRAIEEAKRAAKAEQTKHEATPRAPSVPEASGLALATPSTPAPATSNAGEASEEPSRVDAMADGSIPGIASSPSTSTASPHDAATSADDSATSADAAATSADDATANDDASTADDVAAMADPFGRRARAGRLGWLAAAAAVVVVVVGARHYLGWP